MPPSYYNLLCKYSTLMQAMPWHDNSKIDRVIQPFLSPELLKQNEDRRQLIIIMRFVLVKDFFFLLLFSNENSIFY